MLRSTETEACPSLTARLNKCILCLRRALSVSGGDNIGLNSRVCGIRRIAHREKALIEGPNGQAWDFGFRINNVWDRVRSPCVVSTHTQDDGTCLVHGLVAMRAWPIMHDLELA